MCKIMLCAGSLRGWCKQMGVSHCWTYEGKPLDEWRKISQAAMSVDVQWQTENYSRNPQHAESHAGM
ncbi:hypothetical protein SRHO_G00006210 [Serrasalmus rhombeus]